jgi:hypothetical protein
MPRRHGDYVRSNDHIRLGLQEQPSIYRETQLLHEYADPERFRLTDLISRQDYFEALRDDPEVSVRAATDIERIIVALNFEIRMRMSHPE